MIMLELPLQIYFSVYGGAAAAIDVAAEGEAYVQAFGCFEGDAGGDGEAVAAIGFSFVGNGCAGKIGQLVGGVAVVTEELVIPSDGGVGLPLGAVVAIESLGLSG